MRKVIALAMLVGMLAFSGVALAQTPAEQQYGSETPAAGTQTESTQVKPGVFTPPAAKPAATAETKADETREELRRLQSAVELGPRHAEPGQRRRRR